MPSRFTQGDILRLLGHFNMTRKRKGGTIYAGLGNDGRYRTCKLDFHAGGKPVAQGTATKMAKDLFFESVEEMKEYLDINL
jgi:hypothetical protein